MIKLTSYQLEYNSKEREEFDLDDINYTLSIMKHKSIQMENLKCYLAETRDATGNLIRRRYGLDHATILCSPASNGYIYQIDTAVADSAVDSDVFLNAWRSRHPDRSLQTVYVYDHGTVLGYVILYRQV